MGSYRHKSGGDLSTDAPPVSLGSWTVSQTRGGSGERKLPPPSRVVTTKCGTAADGITEPRRSRKMMQAKAPPGRAHGFNLSNGSISDIYEAHLDTIQPGSGSRSTVSPSLSASPSLSLAADLMYNLGFLYLPATCPPRPSDGSPCYFSLSGQALDFHSRTKAMKFLPYVDFPRSVLALRIPIRGGLAALARDIIKIARDSRAFSLHERILRVEFSG